MKIKIVQHSKNWKKQFELIKSEINSLFPDNEIIIEHIGSTSVKSLAAKPIIDIMIGVDSNQELDSTIIPLINKGYIYYECYNKIMPNRRFFVKLKHLKNHSLFKSIYSYNDELPHEEINNLRLAQIHVWKYNSEDWIRHIVVRDYLRINQPIRLAYQKIKIELSQLSWKDGMDYNSGKNDFMIRLEKEALNYYKNK